MLLHNKTTRIVNVHVGAAITGGKLAHLMPGVNKLDDAEWDNLKKNPEIKRMIDEGEFVALKHKETESIATLDPKKATELVYDCVNQELLLEWQSQEKRGGVLAAISKQLKKIDHNHDEEGRPLKAASGE